MASTFGPYPGVVEKVVDGDTLYVALDVGFDLTIHSRVRLVGINAPERSTPEGKAAQDYIRAIVLVGDRVGVVSHGWDKYGGRVDGVVLLDDGRDLATEMVAAGHAKLWDGTGPRP